MLRNLVIRFNPAYFYMDMSRAIFYLHQCPSGAMLLRGGVVGIIVTVLGLVMYSRAKKNMILYV
jgi:ABC-type polysaccharide/polyol phosphate export permease